MPKRTRTHELEDVSRTRLKAKLPTNWVCRDKPDNDYGVDQEVELFDEDGESTGLLFYVQLKATDDPTLKDSVPIRIDRLTYLASLDAPSIIARYCAASDTFYWIWLTNALLQITDPEAKTVTLKFSEYDLWEESTPLAMERTLAVYRTIRIAPRNIPIGLVLDLKHIESKIQFPIQRVVSKLIDETTSLHLNNAPQECLPIDIRYFDNRLVLAVDCICSLGFELDQPDFAELLSRLAYGLALIADRYDFAIQARDLADFIRRNSLTLNNREAAATVALTMVDNPELAVELACLNEIPNLQDDAYAIFMHGLLTHQVGKSEKSLAVQQFYELAIESHGEIGGSSLAVLHYSLANFQVSLGEFAESVRNFNLARKYDPDYQAREYYLSELGGLLFFTRHFACSSICYGRAFDISPDPHVAICYGDALLYSGEVRKAQETYRTATGATDQDYAAEARLKLWLSEWVISLTGEERVNAKSLLSDLENWQSLVNQGFENANFEDALGGCLMVGFLWDDNVEVWEAALTAAAMTQNTEMLLDVFSCAVRRTGYDAYSNFREKIEKIVDNEDWIRSLDEIVDDFYQNRSRTTLPNVKFRTIEPNNFDIVKFAE